MQESKNGKSETGHGCYCTHCADSKYPCVTMEKVLNSKKSKDKTDGKKKQE